MADLAVLSGIFVSVFTEHYDYNRRDGSRAVGDSHILSLLVPETGEVVAVEVREDQAAEFLRHGNSIGDRITVEVEYRAKPARQAPQVVKAFRRIQRPADANGHVEAVGAEA